jgi:hypothetical protein
VTVILIRNAFTLGVLTVLATFGVSVWALLVHEDRRAERAWPLPTPRPALNAAGLQVNIRRPPPRHRREGRIERWLRAVRGWAARGWTVASHRRSRPWAWVRAWREIREWWTGPARAQADPDGVIEWLAAIRRPPVNTAAMTLAALTGFLASVQPTWAQATTQALARRYLGGVA